MTLGEHIQQLRKARGLSQEALGEALGVTRQSISKWESDLAVPEVEKLIAMSRLFEVSVGALLQVEEPAPPGEASGELTEREWKAVEAIASRYVEKMSGTGARRVRKKWPILACGIVAVAVVCLFGHMGRLTNQLASLQGNLSRLSATVSGQIGDLTDQMEDILDRQNRVTAASSCQVAGVGLEPETITFDLSALPREYVPGMTAEFSAVLEDDSVVTVPGAEEDRLFAARLTCPLSDVITLSVSFLSGGRVQTQLLGREEGWLSDNLPRVSGGTGIFGDRLGTNGYYLFHSLFVGWDNAELKTAGGVRRVSLAGLSLTIYVNGEPAAAAIPVDLSAAEVSEEGGRLEVPLDVTLFLKAGDEVILVAQSTDDIGRMDRKVLDGYRVDEENCLFPISYWELPELP